MSGNTSLAISRKEEEMKYTRKNAWHNGGTFENEDLLWYAKGIGVMQSRALDDPSSWWFFAAIHGEGVTQSAELTWDKIPGPPQVPTKPVPIKSVCEKYWNQCQHISWYFAPWHRGYLLALEAHIRAAVVSLGGPSSWALPYWNYFGSGDQYKMPPAFAQKTLPSRKLNPLFVTARYGLMGDGEVFVDRSKVSQKCQTEDRYTSIFVLPPIAKYGGPKTGFWHGDHGGLPGAMEQDPHNPVHNHVGGKLAGINGLMRHEECAALDPIFYLHHCNLDRMWASWNDHGNKNPTDPDWLKGPSAAGEREFIMPMPNNVSWEFKPEQVNSLDQLDYTYEDLKTAPAQVAKDVRARRLGKLGILRQGDRMESKVESELARANVDWELVGANDSALPIKSSVARAAVKLDEDVRRKVSASLTAEAGLAHPDQVYLNLENIRGNRNGYSFDVYVNDKPAGTVATFGLRNASLKDGRHGGEGLTFQLDITTIIDDLHINNVLGSSDSLDVRVMVSEAVPDDTELTIERISIYRLGKS